MQTKGHPKQLLLHNLEQKAYLELEVTYETENLYNQACLECFDSQNVPSIFLW